MNLASRFEWCLDPGSDPLTTTAEPLDLEVFDLYIPIAFEALRQVFPTVLSPRPTSGGPF